MNAAEALINDRKTNEIVLLRSYVDKMASMTCGRVAWGEYEVAPETCACPTCEARECIATLIVMAEVYAHAPEG